MGHLSDGIACEQEIASRLRRLGWNVEATPTTGDFGADLVARTGREIMVVQCKDYGTPVGIGAIQECHFARTHYQAAVALVVAPNGFTRAAVQAANTTAVQLARPDDFVSCSAWDRRSIWRETNDRITRDHLAYLEVIAFDRKRAQIESPLGDIWRTYDKSVACSERDARRSSLLTKAAILFFALSVTLEFYEIWLPVITAGVSVACLSLRKVSVAPHPPALKRKGALRKCDICLSTLRLDFGRIGQIRCPHCGTLMGSAT